MGESINKSTKVSRESFFTKKSPDITLIFTIIFLTVFGIIMVYSSSYYASFEKYGNHIEFFKKQFIWSLIGILLMFLISNIHYKYICKFWSLIYIVCLICLILVLFIGDEINGAKRWLDLKIIGFQPSEMAKLAVIITMSVCLTSTQKYLDRFKVFAINMAIILIPVILIGIENMSTACVVLAIGMAMIFVSLPNKKSLIRYIIIPACIFVSIIIITIFIIQAVPKNILPEYRFNRIDIFLKGPESDPTDLGYQTIQSLYAIGSGGLFGKGLGNSMQKNGFIPEAHNDIIFSIVCEELGLFGAIIVLLLFIILIWRCMVIASNCKDMQGLLIVAGVMTQIAVQVIINIAVVTNSMPVTGMPLPFISYGGSSLVFLMIEIGLVLNVSKNTGHI